MFFSVSFCMIFATAISKSSWVTCTRRSRSAYMPAKVLRHNHRTTTFKSQIFVLKKLYIFTETQAQDWPASVQVPFTSAPELPPICSAIFLKFIPLNTFFLSFVFVDNRRSYLVRFIFLEWILRMSRRASSFGGGNSIFLNCIILNLSSYSWHTQQNIELIFSITLNWFITRPINTTRPEEGRVKNVNPVRCHDHLKCKFV